MIRTIKKYSLLSFLWLMTGINIYGQGIDLIGRIGLIITPIGEVSETVSEDTLPRGILASLPLGCVVQIEGDIILTDTTGLTHLIVRLGSEPGSANILERVVDFQEALRGGEPELQVNEGTVRINLGQYSKPDYLWLEVKSRNKQGYLSEPLTYETF